MIEWLAVCCLDDLYRDLILAFLISSFVMSLTSSMRKLGASQIFFFCTASSVFQVPSPVHRYHEMGSPSVISVVETFLFKTCVSSERWMRGKVPTVSCTR